MILDTPEILAASSALTSARHVLAHTLPTRNTNHISRAIEFRDTFRSILASRIHAANPSASSSDVLTALAAL